MTASGPVRGPILAREPLIVAVLEAVNTTRHSDREIAYRAGVHFNMISELRAGRRSSVRLHCFIAIASVVGFDVALVRK